MLELGGGRLIEGFEEQLVGRERGRGPHGRGRLPGRLPGRGAGRASTPCSTSTSRTSSEKELPELDDDFASEASEFDTLDELRADIEHKLEHAQEHTIEDEFREAAVDAAAAEAERRPARRARRRRAPRRCGSAPSACSRAQGIDPETYLQASGSTREEMVEEAKRGRRPPARARERARGGRRRRGDRGRPTTSCSRRSSAPAEREGAKPEKLLERLEKSGRDVPLRRELRLRKAVDVLAEQRRADRARQGRGAREDLDAGQAAQGGGLRAALDARQRAAARGQQHRQLSRAPAQARLRRQEPRRRGGTTARGIVAEKGRAAPPDSRPESPSAGARKAAETPNPHC